MGEISMTSDSPETLKEEHKQITDLGESQLKKGDKWYLLDSRWYEQWKKYVTNNNRSWNDTIDLSINNPGPINNSPLFADKTCQDIKEHLVERLQYMLLPAKAWEILSEHYGVMNDEPSIERMVIDEGQYIPAPVVEIYPVKLKLCNYDNKDCQIVKKCSRVMTIDELEKEMRKLFEIPTDHETRILNAFLESDYVEMKRDDTVGGCSLQNDQVVMLEVKATDGKWPRGDVISTSSTKLYNGSSKSNTSFKSTPSISNYQLRNNSPTLSYNKKSIVPGLCGLNNLGNTCFMNSALQCLSNVPELTNYFKSNNYRKELNVNNPLGMGGKIAKNYANLIQTMWSGENSSHAPREFKYAVGQFQSRFLGYQQQDSQELLAFLIDGLHEDLNRITKKPYIEMKDDAGRDHTVVAAEAWENHLKRNNSIIVDILHGLYRSTVDCPECPRVSVTFDPFCFLTLPLPAKRDRSMECTFVPVDPSEDMVKYKVIVPKMGRIIDVCKAVSQFNEKPASHMTVTDIYNNRFHKIFESSDVTRNIYDKDFIYVFESPPEARMVPVYMRYVSVSGSCHLFGQPMLLPVYTDDVTYDQLYKGILRTSWRYMKRDENENGIDDLMMGGECAAMEVKSTDLEEEQEVNVEEATSGGRFNLFVIKAVNVFGTQEYKHYENTDKPFKLPDNIYLAADWNKPAYDKYFSSNLWLDEVIVHESAQPGLPKKAASSVNLMDCMKLFTTEEKLGEDNTWYCSNCKKHQQALKKFDLWMLPPVLIIHLKRFSNTRWSRDKLDTFIDFPTKDLDLSKFIVNPTKDKLPGDKRRYNLIAVSNHYGGLGGGHYTAFAKNCIDKQWHYFDDSSVSSSSEDRVVTKAAYMLVYQRQDLEEHMENNPGQQFPFLEPIFSPRAMEIGAADVNGSPFNFGGNSNEDFLNNNTSNSMDTT